MDAREKDVTVMLKKGLMAIGFLLVLAHEAVPVRAEQRVWLTPAFGILRDNDSFHNDILWTLGISADFYPVKNLALTPEFYLAAQDVHFKHYLLQPGLMVNYHRPRFFAGVGVVNELRARNLPLFEGTDDPPTVVWHLEWSNVWKYKINAGLKISDLKLTISFIGRFDDLGWFPTAVSNAYGAAIGYTF